MSNINPVCRYCGALHSIDRCPRIIAIDYWPDGRVKHVELGPYTSTNSVLIEPPPPDLVLGDLTVNTGAHIAYWKTQPLKLTAGQHKMLIELVKRPGVSVSREKLLDAACGVGSDTEIRTADTYIRRMRWRFEDIEPNFERIECVRSFGYLWRP